LFINFIDFRKAFDSIRKDAPWKVLFHYGIPEKLVKMIRLFYDGFSCSVTGNEKNEKDWFIVATGVRQGCNISPVLFIIILDYILKSSVKKSRCGLRWNLTAHMQYLAFADDICLFSTNQQGITNLTDYLAKSARKVGLIFNFQKTKVLKNLHAQVEQSVVCNSNELEYVDSFVYLGTRVDREGGAASDLMKRKAIASATYGRLGKLRQSRCLKTNIKLKIFNFNVMSVLLYGCETWKLNFGDSQPLKTFQQRCLTRILGVRWKERITNQEVLRLARQDDVARIAEQRRWR